MVMKEMARYSSENPPPRWFDLVATSRVGLPEAAACLPSLFLDTSLWRLGTVVQIGEMPVLRDNVAGFELRFAYREVRKTVEKRMIHVGDDVEYRFERKVLFSERTQRLIVRYRIACVRFPLARDDEWEGMPELLDGDASEEAALADSAAETPPLHDEGRVFEREPWEPLHAALP